MVPPRCERCAASLSAIAAATASRSGQTGERISIRGGASSLGWDAQGDWTLTIVTPGAPHEIAAVPPLAGSGGPEFVGCEFVMSNDERYLALFLYSGQCTQGFELFTLWPAFKHIGGVPEKRGR